MHFKINILNKRQTKIQTISLSISFRSDSMNAQYVRYAVISATVT